MLNGKVTVSYLTEEERLAYIAKYPTKPFTDEIRRKVAYSDGSWKFEMGLRKRKTKITQ
jgi:hypothetical protein